MVESRHKGITKAYRNDKKDNDTRERRLGMFFFKSYIASYGYVRRPGTDRISEEVNKKLRRNRNCDSCGKSATGTENTGIRRIPAGICNLG